LQGHGGWPLTAFLTPELKPFFGGTYFPPERRWQMPGMREILPSIADAWNNRKEELAESAEKLTQSLKESFIAEKGLPVSPAILEAAFSHAVTEFDPSHGGFGAAPKFPRSHELSFLLRYAVRTQTPQAIEMVEITLDHLSRGGIHDHLGGGFHRYSTDAQWLVPHFEKMLYDQALLATTYVEAYQLTHKEGYAAAARDIFSYVLRDLTDTEGGFYSAEDADTEGVEGKFYVWTPDEIKRVLGDKEASLFNEAYGVTQSGNFEHGNILSLQDPETTSRFSASREKLLKARSGRARPHRDDKILTSWNGLMIAAFAKGSAALEEPRYLEAAQRAASFILAKLQKGGMLLRRYRDGEALYGGSLEDYAFFTYGLLALYEADYNPQWLIEAKRLTDDMIARFWDKREGGFFLRSQEEAPLIVQSKELYDGATPSGNSVALCVLAQLGRLLAQESYEALAHRALERFSPWLAQMAWASPQLLQAVDFTLGPTQEVVIAGPRNHASTQAMMRAVNSRFLPRTVVVFRSTGQEAIEKLIPPIKQQGPIGGEPAAYVCQQYACKQPTASLKVFERLLDGFVKERQ